MLLHKHKSVHKLLSDDASNDERKCSTERLISSIDEGGTELYMVYSPDDNMSG